MPLGAKDMLMNSNQPLPSEGGFDQLFLLNEGGEHLQKFLADITALGEQLQNKSVGLKMLELPFVLVAELRRLCLVLCHIQRG